RLRYPHLQLLHALQVKIVRLARVGKGIGQSLTASNYVGKIRKIDGVGRLLGLISDREDIAPIFVVSNDRATRELRCPAMEREARQPYNTPRRFALIAPPEAAWPRPTK